MNRRTGILLGVLLLVIGFATVTTTLVLNGTLMIGENDDFKIIFTSAKLDGKKKNSLISDDKKTITFETKELSMLDDKSTLEYTAANTSRNYDANVTVNCHINENDEISSNPNIDITYEPKNMIVDAGQSKTGIIEVKLIQVLTKSEDIDIKCELIATPVERDTLGDEYFLEIEPFSKAGTLRSIESTWESSMHDFVPIADDFWKYAYLISRVTFENEMIPHETSDDLIFDVSAENSENIVMAYLVENDEKYESLNGELTMYDLYIQSETGVKANPDSSNLFLQFNSLREVNGLENFDTSEVVSMNRMFAWCQSLINLDLSNFDMSSVTDMEFMFYECWKLEDLYLGRFDINSDADTGSMFDSVSSSVRFHIKDNATRDWILEINPSYTDDNFILEA